VRWWKARGVPGVIGLALGSEDFALAIGVPPSPEALDLPCRLLALSTSSAGCMALGLPVSIATIEDAAAWQKAVHLARASGLTGALCNHPRQVAAVTRASRRRRRNWRQPDG
jgi:citrate lyase subunit beta/citryl-CoA lyase